MVRSSAGKAQDMRQHSTCQQGHYSRQNAQRRSCPRHVLGQGRRHWRACIVGLLRGCVTPSYSKDRQITQGMSGSVGTDLTHHWGIIQPSTYGVSLAAKGQHVQATWPGPADMKGPGTAFTVHGGRGGSPSVRALVRVHGRSGSTIAAPWQRDQWGALLRLSAARWPSPS